MPQRSFGSTGRPVALVGQGTWQLDVSPRRAVRALQAGLDHGATHIDTAEIYADGEVERLVGRALRGRRDEAFLVSKVDPGRPSAKEIAPACEASLRRLGTERLDVYLLHWLPRWPLAAAVDALEGLKSAGRILHWGVSNFDEKHLRELLAIAGPGTVACNQVMHHPGERCIEHTLVPYCEAMGIAVVGYSPFGAGRLQQGSPGWTAFEASAAELGATPGQVILAFLLRASRGFLIPRSSDPLHVEENAKAATLELPDELYRRLDAAFPAGEPRAGVPTW